MCKTCINPEHSARMRLTYCVSHFKSGRGAFLSHKLILSTLSYILCQHDRLLDRFPSAILTGSWLSPSPLALHYALLAHRVMLTLQHVPCRARTRYNLRPSSFHPLRPPTDAVSEVTALLSAEETEEPLWESQRNSLSQGSGTTVTMKSGLPQARRRHGTRSSDGGTCSSIAVYLRPCIVHNGRWATLVNTNY